MHKQLGYKKFGRLLLKTGDLDPVYSMLVATDIDSAVKIRFCFAYWLFYHVGVAAQIASRPSGKFFDEAKQQFEAGCPRGTERRHFRGDKAWKAIIELEKITHGTVEPLVRHLFAEPRVMTPPTFADVRDRVLALPQFGPWMAFKVADMGERVLHYKVDFSGCDLQMYRDPLKGLALVATGDQYEKIKRKLARRTVRGLIKYFADFKAPPGYDRPVNIQEVETILCKYKSHVNKHYPVGKDTLEIHEALKDTSGKLARKLRKAVETIPAFKRYAR